MAVDFDKIFAGSGSTYTPTDEEYLQGFDFLAGLPPSVELFNALLQIADLKSKELNNNKAENSTLAESTGYGVIEGLSISAQNTPDMSVYVEGGTIHMPSGKRFVIAAIAALAILAADPLLARIDLVYVNSGKQVVCAAGTAASNPSAPTLPDGAVKLTTITVPAGTTGILNENIDGNNRSKNYIISSSERPDNPTKSMIWINPTGSEILRYDGSDFVPFNVINVVNVKSFGAKGNGVTDDTAAFNKAFKALTTGSVLFVPVGTYKISSQLVIPVTALGAMIRGDGSIQSLKGTVIEINSNPGISLLATAFTFKDVKFRLTVTATEEVPTVIIKDDRNDVNLDVHIDGCSFENASYALDANGRGVTVENCLFYQIYQAWVRVNDFSVGNIGTGFFSKEAGMRGYFISGNRGHYSDYCYALENIGANAQNIVGIQIADNIFESGRIINGAMKDALVTGNTLYQQNSTGSEALFNCTTIKNAAISGNTFKGEDATNSVYSTLLSASGDVEDLTITGNTISNVNNNVLLFSGLVTNLTTQGNIARKICLVNGSYVSFIGATCKNIVIDDTIQSPERSDWVAIQKADTTNVYEYKINTTINGSVYSRLHRLDPTKHSDSSINKNVTGQVSGTYTGTGSGTKTIVCKFKPSYVRISASDGTSYAKSCDATVAGTKIVINGDGVTFDATLNTSGVEYYWTAF